MLLSPAGCFHLTFQRRLRGVALVIRTLLKGLTGPFNFVGFLEIFGEVRWIGADLGCIVAPVYRDYTGILYFARTVRESNIIGALIIRIWFGGLIIMRNPPKWYWYYLGPYSKYSDICLGV